MENAMKRNKIAFIVAFAIVLLLASSLEIALANPTASENTEKSPPPGMTESYIESIRNKLNSINDLLKRLVEEKEKHGLETSQGLEQGPSLLDEGGCYAESFLYASQWLNGWYEYEEDWIGAEDGYGTYLVADTTVNDTAFVVGEMGMWAERNDDIYLRCRTLEINWTYENFITVWTNEDLEEGWYCAGWAAPNNQTQYWQTLELEPDPFNPSPSDGAFKYIAICVFKEWPYQQASVEVDSVYADVLYYELSISYSWGGYTSCTGVLLIREGTSSPQITAIPYEGYAFDHWESDLGDLEENPVNVTMDSDHYLKAHFCVNGTGYTVTVCAYLDEPYQGYITGVDIGVYVDGHYFTTIDEPFSGPAGTHTIGVDDWFQVDYGFYLVFIYFDVGDGSNPTTVNVTSDMTATAHYYLSV